MIHLSVDVTHLLIVYGYWAIFVLIAVESMGIPVPGETMLMAASIYAATTHHLHIVLVIVAAVAGAVVGDNIGYLIGREGGYRLLHRYGRYIRLDERKLLMGRYLFDRHGGKMVFLGRFVPILRIWAAFLAGTHRMSWKRFLLFNAAGGAVWAMVMGSASYGFGHAIAHLGGVVGAGIGVLGVGMMVLMMLGLRRSEQRLEKEVSLTYSTLHPIAA